MFYNIDLCKIFRVSADGLDPYTAKIELKFDGFYHIGVVKNICRRCDLSDDVCTLSFRS